MPTDLRSGAIWSIPKNNMLCSLQSAADMNGEQGTEETKTTLGMSARSTVGDEGNCPAINRVALAAASKSRGQVRRHLLNAGSSLMPSSHRQLSPRSHSFWMMRLPTVVGLHYSSLCIMDEGCTGEVMRLDFDTLSLCSDRDARGT